MAKSRLRGFHDLRTESDGDDAHLINQLLKNWPCVPSRDSDAAASALDCVAILLRSIYAKMKEDFIPKPNAAEDAFIWYAWSLFDEQGDTMYGERLRQSRNAALQVVKPGTNGKSGLSFAELCRSSAMVDALWKHPRFHLTHPWIIKGPEYPEEGAVCRGHEEISRDVLPWDGAKPETVEQLVSKVTMTKRSGENTKLVYFNSPEILQVELATGEGSTCRLVDHWRFNTHSWVPGPDDDEDGLVLLTKGRMIAYIMTAIVRHKSGERNADSIRIFREDGAEQLPEGRVMERPMPDWGFRLGDVVPPGEKISIFYTSYPDIDHLPPPQECAEKVQMPPPIRASILDAFKVFEGAENPAARPGSSRGRGSRPAHHDSRQQSFGGNMGDYGGSQQAPRRRRDAASGAPPSAPPARPPPAAWPQPPSRGGRGIHRMSTEQDFSQSGPQAAGRGSYGGGNSAGANQPARGGSGRGQGRR